MSDRSAAGRVNINELLAKAENARFWASDEADPKQRAFYLDVAVRLEAEARDLDARQRMPEPEPEPVAVAKEEPAEVSPKKEEPKAPSRAPRLPREDFGAIFTTQIGALIETMNAPKTIVRDANGRPTGIKPLMEPDAGADLAEIKASIASLVKTMTTPKEIIRDADGRPVGVKPVVDPSHDAPPSDGGKAPTTSEELTEIRASIGTLINAVSAPKEIMRDAEGRPVSIKPVMPPAPPKAPPPPPPKIEPVAIKESIDELAKAASAPQTIVRDDQGRLVGVKPVRKPKART